MRLRSACGACGGYGGLKARRILGKGASWIALRGSQVRCDPVFLETDVNEEMDSSRVPPGSGGGRRNGIAEVIDRFFEVTAKGSTISTEMVGGLTTFLTMAYIVAVNPALLSEAGVPSSAALTATCFGAAAMTLLMGLVANKPIALASGMGINAMIPYTLCMGELAVDWRVAMAIVFLEGLIILVLVITGLRHAIMEAIPPNLRYGIAVGIGFLIAFIGLQGGGLVIGSDSNLVSIGDLTSPACIVSIISIVVVVVLQTLKVRAGIFISIIVAVVVGIPLGVTPLPESWNPVLDFSSFGAPFQTVPGTDGIALVQVLLEPALLLVVFSFMVSDFFDTLGGVIPLAKGAGFMDEKGDVEGMQRILVVDSAAAATGGLIGASSITLFAESAAGISSGAKTGLSNVVIALLFVVVAFFSPIVSMVSGSATCGALVLAGFLIVRSVVDIDWEKLETAIPAFLTIVFTPLAYSISTGIGVGFIAYCVIMTCLGKARQVKPLIWVAFVAFLAYFVFG